MGSWNQYLLRPYSVFPYRSVSWNINSNLNRQIFPVQMQNGYVWTLLSKLIGRLSFFLPLYQALIQLRFVCMHDREGCSLFDTIRSDDENSLISRLDRSLIVGEQKCGCMCVLLQLNPQPIVGKFKLKFIPLYCWLSLFKMVERKKESEKEIFFLIPSSPKITTSGHSFLLMTLHRHAYIRRSLPSDLVSFSFSHTSFCSLSSIWPMLSILSIFGHLFFRQFSKFLLISDTCLLPTLKMYWSNSCDKILDEYDHEKIMKFIPLDSASFIITPCSLFHVPCSLIKNLLVELISSDWFSILYAMVGKIMIYWSNRKFSKSRQ